MFAARARGSSMEPKIDDGTWCLFHPNVVGTRQDRIVLVEDQSKIGGDRYTLKKGHSGNLVG
jgi:phage repressor protein C with HTH and peptisase S24 domain